MHARTVIVDIAFFCLTAMVYSTYQHGGHRIVGTWRFSFQSSAITTNKETGSAKGLTDCTTQTTTYSVCRVKTGKPHEWPSLAPSATRINQQMLQIPCFKRIYRKTERRQGGRGAGITHRRHGMYTQNQTRNAVCPTGTNISRLDRDGVLGQSFLLVPECLHRDFFCYDCYEYPFLSSPVG